MRFTLEITTDSKDYDPYIEHFQRSIDAVDRAVQKAIKSDKVSLYDVVTVLEGLRDQLINRKNSPGYTKGI